MSALRCGKTSLSPWLAGLDLASDARTTVVDVSALTETSSERGLLGFDFSADGTKLHFDYTTLSASRDVELTVDRATGDWWIADVGQGSWEEINHEPTGQRGNSYGWKRCEGDQLFSSITAPTPSSQSTRPPMPAEPVRSPAVSSITTRRS
jgi:hypothetical protein